MSVSNSIVCGGSSRVMRPSATASPFSHSSRARPPSASSTSARAHHSSICAGSVSASHTFSTGWRSRRS